MICIYLVYFAGLLCQYKAFAELTEDLIQAIEAKIAEKCYILDPVVNINLNDSIMSASSIDLTKLECNAKFQTVDVDIIADGNLERVSGSYDTAVYIPMLSHDVERGEMISEADIISMKIQKRHSKINYAISNDALLGKVAKRRLHKYSPIHLSDVYKKPVVEKNNEVMIVLVKRSMTISAKAKAISSGFIGDTIKVRSIDSGKIMSGVIGENGIVYVK